MCSRSCHGKITLSLTNPSLPRTPRVAMNILLLLSVSGLSAYVNSFTQSPEGKLPPGKQGFKVAVYHEGKLRDDHEALTAGYSLICKKFNVKRGEVPVAYSEILAPVKTDGELGKALLARPHHSDPSGAPAAAAATAAQTAGGQDAHDEQDGESEKTAPLTIFLLCCIAAVVAILASTQLLRLYLQYIHVEPATNLPRTRSFKQYLQYRFDYWFAWTPGSRAMIMSCFIVVIVAIGSTFYFIGVGSALRTCMWKAVVWLIDPNAGAEEDTIPGAAVGAAMSVCGLIVFAFLLTLLQESFANYLESLREGHSAVMERGHILLIGVTKPTIAIIKEFCMANEANGGVVIVVLAEHMTKPEMEALIHKNLPDKLGSRVVVRGGRPHHAEDLKHVAADTASTIVLMPNFQHAKETRDASMLHTLITLHGQGWPTDGKVIAVCSLVRNKPIFKKIGGPHAVIVIVDVFLARLMVQCSNHFGIGRIVNKTFGFEGSEFYFARVPERLCGKNFAYASAHYPDAVLVGVVSDKAPMSPKKLRRAGSVSTVDAGETHQGEVQLCPPMNYVLKRRDELVLIAEDSDGAKARDVPCITDLEAPGQGPVAPQVIDAPLPSNEEPSPENILMLGWNSLSGMILLELDDEVAEGSTVTIMAPAEPASREAFIQKTMKRWNRRLHNITHINHIQAELGSHFQLETLPVPLEEAARIFVLGEQDLDESTSSSKVGVSDACTFAMVLQLEHILDRRLKKSGRRNLMPIVAEIKDAHTAKQDSSTGVADFVNLSEVPAQVLAMIAHQPRIMDVLEEIISDHANTFFAIQPLETYIEPGQPVPREVSFFEARHAAHKRGDIVIGWSLPRGNKDDEDECMMGTKWQINPPDKAKPRIWSQKDDKLVVLRLDPG